MNDKNGNSGCSHGYISLTTHELNISESKYSGNGGAFSASDNGNAYGRDGRRGASRTPKNKHSSCKDNRNAAKSRTGRTPEASNATSERRAFRLRKM